MKKLVASAALIALLCGAASAQTRTLAEIVSYQGPDRLDRLAQAAKREGAVSIYTSRGPEDLQPVTDAFTKRYGVEVQVWRASTEAILQRAVAENRAGRCPADAFSTGAPTLEPLHRENMLQPVKSPTAADLMPEARPSHGDWVTVGTNVLAAAYNTRLVRQDELPKSYEDLKDPRWKGRLAIEADDVDWFATIVTKMGEAKGLKLFSDIVRTNGMSVRKGHTLIANMVAAGEVPFSLTSYAYKPEQMKKAGAPIGTVYLPPVIALATGIGVARCAPHPNAAVLFYEFMLHDAQSLVAERGIAPTNLKLRPKDSLVITFMDTEAMLDNGRKWADLWDKTILHPQ
jgi:iron(III) transport system substrate-binding protein